MKAENAGRIGRWVKRLEDFFGRDHMQMVRKEAETMRLRRH